MFEREHKEFKAWLASRQRHFDEQNISIDDIASLALVHGLDLTVVRQWQSSQRFKQAVKS